MKKKKKNKTKDSEAALHLEKAHGIEFRIELTPPANAIADSYTTVYISLISFLAICHCCCCHWHVES